MRKIVLFLFLLTLRYSYSYYGAVAINVATGNTGYSYDYGTRSEAEERALRECGSNCEIALWIENTCGAVSYSKKHKIYGWAWGDDSWQIERDSVKECGESDCVLEVSLCTTRYY